MRPLQRRILAFCVFALTFNLFYEARGKRLLDIWREGSGSPSVEVFKQHALTGAIVLLLGGTLLFVLRRSDEKFQYSLAELVWFCLGLGLLIGTLVISWLHVSA